MSLFSRKAPSTTVLRLSLLPPSLGLPKGSGMGLGGIDVTFRLKEIPARSKNVWEVAEAEAFRFLRYKAPYVYEVRRRVLTNHMS